MITTNDHHKGLNDKNICMNFSIHESRDPNNSVGGAGIISSIPIMSA